MILGCSPPGLGIKVPVDQSDEWGYVRVLKYIKGAFKIIFRNTAGACRDVPTGRKSVACFSRKQNIILFILATPHPSTAECILGVNS